MKVVFQSFKEELVEKKEVQTLKKKFDDNSDRERKHDSRVSEKSEMQSSHSMGVIITYCSVNFYIFQFCWFDHFCDIDTE